MRTKIKLVLDNIIANRSALYQPYQGLSYKDIANQMDLSTKAIEFHMSKALAQLRFSLKDFIHLLLFLFYFH